MSQLGIRKGCPGGPLVVGPAVKWKKGIADSCFCAAHVQEAFHLLDEFDLVLGPAADGGYYLLGLNRLYKDLFESIPWGTGEVLQATLNKAKLLGIKTVLLERLADVDRPEDLEALTGWSSGYAE